MKLARYFEIQDKLRENPAPSVSMSCPQWINLCHEIFKDVQIDQDPVAHNPWHQIGAGASFLVPPYYDTLYMKGLYGDTVVYGFGNFSGHDWQFTTFHPSARIVEQWAFKPTHWMSIPK